MKIFHGIHMESKWNMFIPYGFHIFHVELALGFHLESRWTPYSFHGMIPHGIHVESIWNKHIPLGFHVDSTWNGDLRR
jgi:hypothetical protein